MSQLAQEVKNALLMLMKREKLTQTEIAIRTGIPRQSVCAILNGDRDIQTDTIEKMAGALGYEPKIRFIHKKPVAVSA